MKFLMKKSPRRLERSEEENSDEAKEEFTAR